MLGVSVAEVYAMSPTEYEGWRWHLHRYPPAEFFLAALLLNVAKALGNDRISVADMGYWLESPNQRKAREAKEARQKRIEKVQFTERIYRRDLQGTGN